MALMVSYAEQRRFVGCIKQVQLVKLFSVEEMLLDLKMAGQLDSNNDQKFLDDVQAEIVRRRKELV